MNTAKYIYPYWKSGEIWRLNWLKLFRAVLKLLFVDLLEKDVQFDPGVSWVVFFNFGICPEKLFKFFKTFEQIDVFFFDCKYLDRFDSDSKFFFNFVFLIFFYVWEDMFIIFLVHGEFPFASVLVMKFGSVEGVISCGACVFFEVVKLGDIFFDLCLAEFLEESALRFFFAENFVQSVDFSDKGDFGVFVHLESK